MDNKTVFGQKDMVEYHTIRNELFKPEEIILNNLKKRLKNAKMLDIGIGSGRTTFFFANLTKEYVGIDYAENMITACNSRFSESSKNISFKLCDVRDMKIFKDNTFDFILFSFNGLDYVPHEDRLKSLQEIKRVCKKGGMFFFSSHNLQNIDRLFPLLSTSYIGMLKTFLRYFVIRIINKAMGLREKRYVFINDGGHRLRLLTYYIKPEEQIKQLKGMGFKNVRVYFLADGKEIKGKSELDCARDNFLYYLCSK